MSEPLFSLPPPVRGSRRRRGRNSEPKQVDAIQLVDHPINSILEERHLKRLAGCGFRCRLRDWLCENRIPYYVNTKGQLVSTMALFESSIREAHNLPQLPHF